MTERVSLPPIDEPPGLESPEPSVFAQPGEAVPQGLAGPGADNRAIASMVLGIVSIVLGCVPLLGVICGTIAIVLYAKFSSAFADSGEGLAGKGMAIAGLVCGIIGAAIGVLYGIYWLVAIVLVGSVGSGLFS